MKAVASRNGTGDADIVKTALQLSLAESALDRTPRDVYWLAQAQEELGGVRPAASGWRHSAGHQSESGIPCACGLNVDEPVVPTGVALQLERRDATERIVLKISRVGGFHNTGKNVNLDASNAIGARLAPMSFTRPTGTALCHLAAITEHYPSEASGRLRFGEIP